MKKKFTFLMAAVMLLMMMSLPGNAVGQEKTAYNGTFTRISSADDFVTGYYVVTASRSASSNDGYALGSAVDGNKRITGVSVNISNTGKIAAPDNAIVYYITRSNTICTFQNVSTSNYMYQSGTTSGKGMAFKAASTNITYSGYNTSSPIGFKFTLNGASNNIFKYNTGNTWFANYSGAYATNMTPVDLFRLFTYSLTYNNAPTGGTVAVTNGSTNVSTGSQVGEGATLNIVATPAPGYNFTGWTVTGTGAAVANASNASTTLTMGSANTTLEATFVPAGNYIDIDPTSANPTCAAQDLEFTVDTDQTLDDDPTVFYTTSAGTTSTTKPSWIGDIIYDEGELVIEVGANTGAERTAYFRVEKGLVKSDVVTITQQIYKSAAPTLTEGGNFDYTKTITITPASGTTVYYTTNGDEPSSSTGTGYTTAHDVTLDATTTVKAIAYDANNYSSDVVSATYTRVYDYISDIDEAAYYTVKGTVVAVNGTNAFVLGDGTGYIYCYMSHSKSVGDLVAITNGHVKNYNHVWEFENGTLSVATLSTYEPGTPAITAWTEEIFNSYSGSGVANLGTYFEVVGTYATTNKEITIAGTDKKVRLSSSNTYSSLNGKTVKAKGYFAGMNTSGTTPSAMYICPESVVECPIVTTSVASITDFTYNVGGGPSVKTFTVSGNNLTNDITVSTNSANFEISSNGTDYQTTDITISKGEGTTISATTIHVRLKAGLSSDTYNGKITVSSDGADDKEIALTGTVKHLIAYGESITGCASIGSTPSDAAVTGTSVSLTATAASGYKFSAWDVYKTGEESTKVTVTENAFSMPAYNVTVSATFEVAYSVTYEGNGSTGGSVPTDSNSPYDSGATVTVLGNTGDLVKTGHTFTGWNTKANGTGSGYTAGATFTISEPTTLYAQWEVASYNVTMSSNDNATLTGAYGSTGTLAEGETKSIEYGTEVTLSATEVAAGKVFFWMVTKNSDSSDVTDDVLDGTTLTVPDYDITIGGTVAELFITYLGDLTEGDYIIARNKKAMNNTVSNNKLGTTDITSYEDDGEVVVANASAYTWHVAKVTDTDYWTIMNGSNYAASTGTKSQAQLTTTNNDYSKWTISGTGGSSGYAIVNKYNSEHSVNAYLRYDNSYYACYASSNNESVFYKKVTGSQHSVTIDGGIVNGSVEASLTNAYEGQSVTLTPTPASGYVFDAWDVYKTGDASTKVTVSNNSFTMPSYDVTVSATFTAPAKYQLVTSGSQLVAGKHYVIASGTSGTAYAMGYQNTNNRPRAEVEFDDDDNILENSNIWDFVLSGWAYDEEEENSGWTFYDKYTDGEGFLYAAGSGSGKNYLKLQSTLDNNGRWSITIDATDHFATIVALGTNTNNNMRYNTGGLFSCYADGQNDIYLYVKVDDSDYEIYSPTTVENLTIASTDTYTVESGQILTVSGTLSNSGNLIIEDGGQLVCNNSVAATVKKNIGSWGSKDATGWNFIASPIADPIDPKDAGLITDNLGNTATPATATYDLYYLNMAAGKDHEWQNYRKNTFNLANGKGYLYANVGTPTLNFSGDIQPSNTTVTKSGLYDGYNLVGNPFTCYASLSTDYYTLNSDGSAIVVTEAKTAPIAPCTGVIIEDDEVTFTPVTGGELSPGKGNVEMVLAQSVATRGESTAKTLDNAIISFNEGSQLGKFYFGTQDANLYIPMDNEEYAIVSSSAQGEMPVNFKAHRDGQYTITVNPQEVEMGYLHLIDNVAGKDIDLLATPSYTFDAKADDYENRFRLVFSANMVNADLNDDFAFFSNGQLVIANEGESLLQVIDVNGRIVMTESVNGTCGKAINVKAGVYVLRLIQGTDVKTQKIIVK